ncbi:hypothetical protein JOB18_035823 [Solea senegalensis]|uniref:Uncharacterized protein n=1 Tax=Solea senegalensis TaxID=28829 RepID=A0AAV6S0T8_SOLSE|nr:hypothetical protein JOB18_035823 [Solea senegalensis]
MESGACAVAAGLLQLQTDEAARYQANKPASSPAAPPRTVRQQRRREWSPDTGTHSVKRENNNNNNNNNSSRLSSTL